MCSLLPGKDSMASELITSPVFVTAHDVAAYQASPPERRMHFSDVELESSEVMAAFLDLATTLHPPTVSPSMWASLIRFLRKWDCMPLHDLLFVHLRVGLREGQFDRLKVFTIGAYLDDLELCKQAIQAPGSSMLSWWLRLGHPDSLSPSAWTLQFWEEHRIPPRYMFALVQGQMRMQGGSKTRQEFAAEFEMLLDQCAGCSK
jgi:hypothetical protein